MKKRILHILNSNAYSGAENVVFSIIYNMEEYDFAYVARQGSIKKKLETEGIKYYLVDNMNVKELRKIIKDFKPDLIHAHDFTASILSAISERKVPIISHLHCNPFWLKKYCIKSIIYYFISRKFVKILGVSESIFKEFVFGKKIAVKSKVIFNPINIEKVKKMSMEKCEKKYDVISLGRLSEAKNPNLFVDIIKESIQKNPNIRAAMIGNGELFDKVKQYIIVNQMEKYIDLLGFKDNPYPYLKEAKILCIPSSWEGFGMVAVEALILGKPVVAAAVGGLPDIVDDSCGKICHFKDEYEEEIIKLLSDENYYKKKSQAAEERARVLQKKIDYYNHLKQIYKDSM